VYDARFLLLFGEQRSVNLFAKRKINTKLGQKEELAIASW